MNQREKLKELLVNFCNNRGSRTFSLQDLHQRYTDYNVIDIDGKTPQATVRRLLQELRDEKFVSFLDKSGHYTLRELDLLDDERLDLKNIDISKESLDKKEYLVETYARSAKWAAKAKEVYGNHCLIDECKNSFLTPNNTPYVEVHHIIPLYQGGEDGIWNLSVLCAHHHRMAHFAQKSIADKMQRILLSKVETYL